MEQLQFIASSEPPQSSGSSSSECWILVQQNDGCGGQFFNRTWSSYREGFGDASGNYWIGNEHLHQMTQILHQGLQSAVFRYRLDKIVCKYRYIDVSRAVLSFHRRSQDFLSGVHFFLHQKSDDIFSHHLLACHMRVRLTMSMLPQLPFYVTCRMHLTKFSPSQQNCL